MAKEISQWQEARRTCEICGERLDPPQGKSPNNKFNHYKKRHPEIQFHQRRQSTEGHTRKTCDLCHKIFKDYGDLVTHYRDRHGWDNITSTQSHKVEVTPTVEDPMQNLDNFFDSMGKVTGEIKSLRQECNDLKLANGGLQGIIEKQNNTITVRNEECDRLKTSNNILIETITSASKELDNWKFKALKWSGQLVSLQEILARPRG